MMAIGNFQLVVQLFLFKRTSNLILTFKNLCDNYLGTGLSQVPPKFEPIDSNFITFFQIQKPPNSIFEMGLIPCTNCTIPKC
jgi:hypothetical protein